jgi:hypothetical protein
MRKIALALIIGASGTWAAGPEVAVPAPPATTPAPVPTPSAEGAVPPAVVVGEPAPGETASGAAFEVSLLTSGENGCTFAVKVPAPEIFEVAAGGRRFDRLRVRSCTPAGEAGAPELLVRHVNVAAPPEAEVAVTVERVSYDLRTGVDLYPRPRLEVEERHGEQTLAEVFTYEAASYRDGAYPARLAEVDGEHLVRGCRLLAVAVYPYQYQPATGTLKVVKEMVVRVSFRGGVRRPNARYPARPVEAGVFGRVLPGVVLNWETAARWPFAGGYLPSRDQEIWPTDFADKAAVKVVVRDPALYRLGYEDLKAAGFPVETLAPANLRLFAGPAQKLPREFGYDPPGLTEMPCYVAGQDDGRFDRVDYVEFYGHGCDYFRPVPAGTNGAQEFSKDRFTRYNVYWLVADEAAGKRAAPASVAPAGGTRRNYFWSRLRLEEDNLDIAETEDDVLEEDEYWYWRQYNAPTGMELLTSFSVPDPYPVAGNAYFQLMVREVEGLGTGNGPHHTRLYLNYPDKDHKFFDRVYTADVETYFHTRFPANLFQNGVNRLYFEQRGDRTSTNDYINFDHVEFEYPRRLRAYQDSLYFANVPGDTGPVLFEVSGFSTADVVVYDVTRGRRLRNFEMKSEGGAYTLRFTDDIPSGQCWYAASSGAATRKPLDLYLDAGSTLREVDEPVNLIVVVYDGFYDSVMPLVNQRRAEGLNVVVGRITDVYDEYSWGLYDPGAIRQFVKDIYGKGLQRQEPVLPDHLMLVGDAFTDHRDNLKKFPGRALWREFGRNTVPTYYVNTAPSGRSASDNFYAAMSDSEGPDLTIGRLSAPYADMVDAIVDKILEYRRNPYNGAWNGRVIFTADNDDKDPEGGRGAFTADNEELEEDFAPLGFEVQKHNIEWLNRRFPYRGPQDEGFDYQTRGERTFNVEKYLKPDFLMGFQGILMHYSGHGGPQVWAHEDLLVHHKNRPPKDDIYKLENGPCLPVIMQCSCSTAYFDQWYQAEEDPRDYGQCISEWLLQEPRDAAIASLGSTRLGTETGQHKFLTGFYSHVFPQRKARSVDVTVGEAHLAGKIAANDDSVRRMFTLLGDPSMVLATPRPGMTLTPNVNTVRRGGKLKVAGRVPGNFNGRAVVRLFDRPWYFFSRDANAQIYRDRLVSEAEVDVVNGRFDVTFVVPTRPANPTPSGDNAAGETVAVSDGGAAAAGAAGAAAAGVAGSAPAPAADVSAPAVGSSLAPIAEDGKLYVKAVAYGTGFRRTYVCNENVTVNVSGEVSSGDTEGPAVGVYLDDYSFRSGDTAGPTPQLIVTLRDESGVLIARNLEAIDEDKGEKTFVPLYAQIDNQPPTDLTYYYRPEVGDYRAGTVERKIALGGGAHRITVTAHDSLGNQSRETVQCTVSGALALFEVMNCPNPFAEDTYFTFLASTDVDSLVIKIYTASGRFIQKLEAGGLPAGYNQVYWDGRDRDGDALANGVYFYKIVGRAGDQRIVARQKMFKLR